jgi:hypothetical protein
MTYPKGKLKNNGDKATPCFKPFVMGSTSGKFFPSQTYRFLSDIFLLALAFSWGYQTQLDIIQLNHMPS